MPFNGEDFQWTRNEAYADQTQGVYGGESDEALERLVDLENGVRKYWADQLRVHVASDSASRPKWAAAVLEAAALLDPYSGKDGADGEFARTTLDDASEGAKWVTPNVK